MRLRKLKCSWCSVMWLFSSVCGRTEKKHTQQTQHAWFDTFFVTIQATVAIKKKKIKNALCFATFKKIMHDSVTPFRRLTSASSWVNTFRLLSHSPSQQFQLQGTASAHTCSSAMQLSERHKRCPDVSLSLEEIFHVKINGSASPCTQRTAERITMLELAPTWQS